MGNYEKNSLKSGQKKCAGGFFLGTAGAESVSCGRPPIKSQIAYPKHFFVGISLQDHALQSVEQNVIIFALLIFYRKQSLHFQARLQNDEGFPQLLCSAQHLHHLQMPQNRAF